MLEEIVGTPELARLTTRRDDDYAITVVDLWAAVADVLTFYQERYANEAFLRTATRRESVARLAALIDYRLRARRGGARTSRVHVEDEQARDAAARACACRACPARTSSRRPSRRSSRSSPTRGSTACGSSRSPSPPPHWRRDGRRRRSTARRVLRSRPSWRPGSGSSSSSDQQPAPVEEKTIAAVRTEGDRAVVTWAQPVERTTWDSAATVFSFARTFRLFGHNAPATYMQPETVLPSGLFQRGPIAKRSLLEREYGFSARLDQSSSATSEAEPRIAWKLRGLQTSDFAYPRSGNAEEAATAEAADTSRLCLDARFEGIAPGARLLVADTRPDGTKRIVTVVEVDQASDALGAVADTVTRVTVTPALGSLPDRRGVVVYELVHELALWAGTYAERLTGDTVLPSRPARRGRCGRDRAGASSAERCTAGAPPAAGGARDRPARRARGRIRTAARRDGQGCRHHDRARCVGLLPPRRARWTSRARSTSRPRARR